MTVVGRIESLWRYPVKSMRGEQLQAAFAGFPGRVRGPRLRHPQFGVVEGLSVFHRA